MSNEGTSANWIGKKPGVPSDAPDVIVFPPVLYGGTLLLGLLLHFLWPVRLMPGVWGRITGGIIVVASGLAAHWASRTMRRAGTNILPNKPTLTIVVEGPFRFTRNPLYLTNALVYLGLTLVLNSLWLLLLLGPMLLVLHWGIIRREERYLEARFEDSYRAYMARVPRWL